MGFPLVQEAMFVPLLIKHLAEKKKKVPDESRFEMSKFCNNNSPLPASLAETAEATLAAIESVLISHLILASCAWVFWSLGGSWRGGGVVWFQWHFLSLT